MTDLKELYLDLCMTSVFSGVMQKPLFKHFFDYSKEGIGKAEKIEAYSRFVSEIYKAGGSLTELVLSLVLQDENVYVRAIAHSTAVAREIVKAQERELLVLERFASLSPDDFQADLQLEYVSPFSSKRLSFKPARFSATASRSPSCQRGIT